mmetsp:Transcript_12772/g.36094  ORF Transcript_12772/g.36094 Transcript_12772/m.36094 type:complete len:615 (-) Transcript_12772:29-1873(-)|eukprot:CAMPEP_0119120898 /NCGR_PEP_ID=MMETSP1310-20130426/1749_1 /TAXON_ID=464262 /ORGANISM="Genus nov. species nov., Strain RCC2339" /LENGTH=614 /DNA_ID=CAMNT_0007110411 /DNA_START=223 /DNA_END=2067 /DNA_ORIENTATION=+
MSVVRIAVVWIAVLALVGLGRGEGENEAMVMEWGPLSTREMEVVDVVVTPDHVLWCGHFKGFLADDIYTPFEFGLTADTSMDSGVLFHSGNEISRAFVFKFSPNPSDSNILGNMSIDGTILIGGKTMGGSGNQMMSYCNGIYEDNMGNVSVVLGISQIGIPPERDFHPNIAVNGELLDDPSLISFEGLPLVSNIPDSMWMLSVTASNLSITRGVQLKQAVFTSRTAPNNAVEPNGISDRPTVRVSGDEAGKVYTYLQQQYGQGCERVTVSPQADSSANVLSVDQLEDTSGGYVLAARGEQAVLVVPDSTGLKILIATGGSEVKAMKFDEKENDKDYVESLDEGVVVDAAFRGDGDFVVAVSSSVETVTLYFDCGKSESCKKKKDVGFGDNAKIVRLLSVGSHGDLVLLFVTASSGVGKDETMLVKSVDLSDPSTLVLTDRPALVKFGGGDAIVIPGKHSNRPWAKNGFIRVGPPKPDQDPPVGVTAHFFNSKWLTTCDALSFEATIAPITPSPTPTPTTVSASPSPTPTPANNSASPTPTPAPKGTTTSESSNSSALIALLIVVVVVCIVGWYLYTQKPHVVDNNTDDDDDNLHRFTKMEREFSIEVDDAKRND